MCVCGFIYLPSVANFIVYCEKISVPYNCVRSPRSLLTIPLTEYQKLQCCNDFQLDRKGKQHNAINKTSAAVIKKKKKSIRVELRVGRACCFCTIEKYVIGLLMMMMSRRGSRRQIMS